MGTSTQAQSPLRTWLKAKHGRTSVLAALMQVSGSLVTQWGSGTKPVPTARCADIEEFTSNRVTRRDLRPNDWWIVWPELVDADHPTPKEDV